MGIEPFQGRVVLYGGGVVFGWNRVGVEPCWGGALKGRAVERQMLDESREGRFVLGYSRLG